MSSETSGMVPGSGIEPPTQGFSGLAHVVSSGRFWFVSFRLRAFKKAEVTRTDHYPPPRRAKSRYDAFFQYAEVNLSNAPSRNGLPNVPTSGNTTLSHCVEMTEPLAALLSGEIQQLLSLAKPYLKQIEEIEPKQVSSDLPGGERYVKFMTSERFVCNPHSMNSCLNSSQRVRALKVQHLAAHEVQPKS